MNFKTLATNSPFIFLLISLGCASLIGIGLIMQHAFEMEPCALCISQRIAIIAVGLTSLIACIHNPRTLGIKLYGFIGITFAFIGSAIAARHVYIQNLPEDEAPLCGPGLGYMFETRPIFDALSLLLKGDGNCADVSFTFLSLSIPAWTLIAFVGLALFNIWVIFHSRKNLSLP